ncbi:hypothetical protein [Nitratidesulfovibrio liaohensis]|uniref:hypothetical protein n=1 Tax=Nitratidesulfovibrio liaohensis TaxID=2604158 RepID=UPI00141DA28E|nr:hypothetical protein [Nitratidesulfovibrio liaohensis]NHZ47361.1 hypothetical protein [Nitratidesulfovibrio liaohensis]
MEKPPLLRGLRGNGLVVFFLFLVEHKALFAVRGGVNDLAGFGSKPTDEDQVTAVLERAHQFFSGLHQDHLLSAAPA